MNHAQFLETLWDFYANHQRELPWREAELDGTFSPYHVLVSELMLQQTQVPRVIPKYQAFLVAFPSLSALAAAPLADVLRLWQGLGYNRRAQYLHAAAKHLATLSEPWTLEQLVSCKGIGHNTAAAVLTYTYNQPHIFVETNVRTVLLHHFFAEQEAVSDSQLIACLEDVIDREHPREFYWALMDYGTHLKQQHGNASRRSAHYKKQSTFAGSRRELRGKIIRALTTGAMQLAALEAAVDHDVRFSEVLGALEAEGLVSHRGHRYELAP